MLPHAGSLFALEVLHRTGMQFFEVSTYAVACGVVCLAVFRGLSGKTFGAVWDFQASLLAVDWRHIVYGETLYAADLRMAPGTVVWLTFKGARSSCACRSDMQFYHCMYNTLTASLSPYPLFA